MLRNKINKYLHIVYFYSIMVLAYIIFLMGIFADEILRYLRQ